MNLDGDDDTLAWTPFSPSPTSIQPSFALSSEGANAARNEQKRMLRESVEAWALRRGCTIDDSVIAGEIDGVGITLALFEVTEALAVVRSTARMPVDVSVVVEPRTLKNDIADRFSKPVHAGDPEFDRTWHIESDHAELARVILDATCRASIQELGKVAWCRTLYDRGRIEIRLDAEGLAGGHLALAMQIAVVLGRTRVPANAYR